MASERSEAATPRRRQEARDRGQVLQSVEVNTAVVLLVGAWMLQALAPSIGTMLLDLLRHSFTHVLQPDFSVQSVHTRALGLAFVVMKALGPFAVGLFAVAALSCLIQVGPLLTWRAIQPQFSRLNPLNGFQRLFSLNALVDLLKSVLKITLVGSVAWFAFQGQVATLSALSDMTPLQAISAVGDAVYQIVWRVVMVFGGLALVDYFYQRYSYEKSLKMSKEDIKEEFKQSEGDPQIRARLRQRARALSRQRMMKQVPQADVVVTNPTHFAVALKYGPSMDAPMVLAKGERLLAQQIKKVARQHHVPMVENRPLAQALFKACEVGQAVPQDLYRAVAEVLAWVYRMYPGRAPVGFSAPPATRPTPPVEAWDGSVTIGTGISGTLG
jgi:flagellar biosynthetic protein FlhB